MKAYLVPLLRRLTMEDTNESAEEGPEDAGEEELRDGEPGVGGVGQGVGSIASWPSAASYREDDFEDDYHADSYDGRGGSIEGGSHGRRDDADLDGGGDNHGSFTDDSRSFASYEDPASAAPVWFPAAECSFDRQLEVSADASVCFLLP